jgi:hypothetical protein
MTEFDFKTLEERMKISQELAKQAAPADIMSIKFGFRTDTGQVGMEIGGTRYVMSCDEAEWIGGCLLDTVSQARKATAI